MTISFKKLRKTSTPEKRHSSATPQLKNTTNKLLTCCATIARHQDILSGFAEAVGDLGLIGEKKNAKILLLSMISASMPRPVSVVVKGARSGGKNTLVDSVLRFFPREAFYPMTAMSEKALAYFSEPLKNRMLVITEAAGVKEGGDYFLRSLLSENHISYQVVVGGKTRSVDIEGPTGLIMTTTKFKLYEDDESRLISLEVTEDSHHIHQVLKGIGRSFADPRKARKKVVPPEWLALVKWVITTPPMVAVPFGEAVGALMATEDSRLFRDANALLGLVCAHALLHRKSRELEKNGDIIATLEDYKVVRGLLHDVIAQGIASAVSPSIRRVVEAARKLDKDGKGVSGRGISSELRINKAGVSRHVNAAIELGFLRNLEEGRGRTARYVLGESLPGDTAAIPTAKAVASYLAAAARKQAKAKG